MKKQKLKLYGVRLRKDQIEFLKGLDDAAKVIRELIDNYILTSGKPDVILVNKKITILNRRINEIMDSPLYKACQFNIDAFERVRDYEDESGTQYEKNIMLKHLVLFQTERIKVHSETYNKTIDESIALINSLGINAMLFLRPLSKMPCMDRACLHNCQPRF